MIKIWAEYLSLLTILSISRGFLITHDAPRNVVKVITTGNGGQWGEWHVPTLLRGGILRRRV